MLSNFPNSIKLLEYAKEKEHYSRLVLQLEKDFVLANISINIDTGITPGSLKIVLHEKIYHLIMERFSEYLNLLYIVDVPEKDFRTIDVTDVVEVSEQVSFLILKRELQKVELKAKYS